MHKSNNEKVMVIRIDNNSIRDRSRFLEMFNDKVTSSSHPIIVIHADSKIDGGVLMELGKIASMNNRLIVTTYNAINGHYAEALTDIIRNKSLFALNIDDLARMIGKKTVFSRLNPHNIKSGLKQLNWSEANHIIAIIRGPKGLKFKTFQDLENKLNVERSPLATLTLGLIEGDLNASYELDVFVSYNSKAEGNYGILELQIDSIHGVDNINGINEFSHDDNAGFLNIPQWLKQLS